MNFGYKKNLIKGIDFYLVISTWWNCWKCSKNDIKFKMAPNSWELFLYSIILYQRSIYYHFGSNVIICLVKIFTPQIVWARLFPDPIQIGWYLNPLIQSNIRSSCISWNWINDCLTGDSFCTLYTLCYIIGHSEVNVALRKVKSRALSCRFISLENDNSTQTEFKHHCENK